MKRIFRNLLSVAAAFVLVTFTACSSGTDTGDTNVERGHEKDKNPAELSNSSGNNSGHDHSSDTTGHEGHNH